MTTTKDEAKRTEFEAWARKQGHTNFMRMAGDPKQYDDLILRAQYHAYCATSHIAPDAAAIQAEQPRLTVWESAMPESNGKSNFTAILMREGGELHEGMTIAVSEYPGRVRYEADEVRWLIGALAERPDILTYDTDKHSGYVEPSPAIAPEASELPPIKTWWERAGLPEGTNPENCGGIEEDWLAEIVDLRAAIAMHRAAAATEDDRAKFEAKYGPKDSFAWRNESGTYKVASLQSAWQVWQDAIASNLAAAEPVPTSDEKVAQCLSCGKGVPEIDNCEDARYCNIALVAAAANPAASEAVDRILSDANRGTSGRIILSHADEVELRSILAAPAAPTDAKLGAWDYNLMGLPNEEVVALWRASGHSGTVPFSFAQRIQDRMLSAAALKSSPQTPK